MRNEEEEDLIHRVSHHAHLGICGTIYYNLVTSPTYSLRNIQESIRNHDTATFEKYGDIKGTVILVMSELPAVINVKQDVDFLPEQVVQILGGLTKNFFMDTVKDRIWSISQKEALGERYQEDIK